MLRLYFASWSPPSCAVRMTAKAIGLKLDLIDVNLLKKDHLKYDFLKMNPQHTVPVLNDDGFVLSDSHAIMSYLVGKYAKDDNLYPKDLKKRALIDQRLHYESGVLFAHLRTTLGPLLRGKRDSVSEDSHQLLEQAYQFLNLFLDGKSWLCDDHYTLADISCANTINCLTVFHEVNNCPNVTKWMKNCQEELPGFDEITKPGAAEFHQVALSKIKN